MTQIYLKNFSLKVFYMILSLIISCGENKKSKFVLPNLYSDGMVLQRDTMVTILGSYIPNQKIDILCSWGFDTTTLSDSAGKWKTQLKTNSIYDPQRITLSSFNDIYKINNILLGEVWIASGQSNMEQTFDYCCNSTDSSESEVLSANFNKIRMYNVKKSLSSKPLNDTQGNWISAVGENIIDFSAAGYFFAKKLHKELDVPIGIIHASWGSSNIQSWTSKQVLKSLEGFSEKFEILNKDSLKYKKTSEWYSKFKNKHSGSGAWDLFLASDVLPDIGYFDFFVPSWSILDNIGHNEIKDYSNDSKYWKELDDKQIIKPILKNPNFSGAVLFKNNFTINSLASKEYFVTIGPDEEAPFKLWEYDIYINGEKQASSLIDLKEEYQFNKKTISYKISPDILQIGNNTIIVRIMGYASFGHLKIKTSHNENILFLNDWKVKLLAEETLQIDNFKYPYTTFYDYSNSDINFEDIPEKFFLTHNTPSTLYNGMMAPLLNYTIKGFIWYQGESNVGEGGKEHSQYKLIFPLMIRDLRKSYGQNMPFYYAQLANYFNYAGMLPYFRQVQNEFLNINNTGMIVTFDIGENYDFHPSNKHDVGKRFALLALNDVYGFNIVSSGPLLRNVDFEGKYANLYFENVDSGLKMIDNKQSWFEIADEDKVYHESKVDLYKNFIQLNSDFVQSPKFVRYAWSDTAKATLFNGEGLPASPFSTEYMKSLIK
tara:strand:+ start:1536 stop:3677 length:2142 start_codon:yes stop_codon:yes gene_type:complete